MKYDVVIVGAGPAGSSTAHFLSSVFKNILLVDRENKLEHEKLCGGALAQDTLSHLKTYWDIELDKHQLFNGGKVYNKGNLLRKIISEDLQIGMVMRRDLDSQLIHIVVKKGVEVRLSSKVTKVKQSTSGYTLTIGNEEIQTGILVAADGAPSFIRKQLGLGEQEYQQDLVMTYEFHTQNTLNLDLPRLYFGDLDGYGWIYPKGDMLTIGVGGFADGLQLKNYLSDICEKEGIEIENLRGHWIPFSNAVSTGSHGSCYFVGDAVNLVEPLAGKGIYYALESGRQLALALQGSDPQRTYDDFLDTIRKEIYYGLKIRWFLYRRPWVDLGMTAIRKIDYLAQDLMRVICGQLSFEDFWWSIWKRAPKLLIKTLV